MRKTLIGVLAIIIFVSCNKETKYSSIPKLAFKDMTPREVQEGSNGVIRIRLDFEDGDGNIGFNTPNLFFKDNRDTAWVPFIIPDIPEKFNPSAGLKGIFQIDYDAAFLLIRVDSLNRDRDTLTWDIYMMDKAGNKSNIVTTDTLYLTR